MSAGVKDKERGSQADDTDRSLVYGLAFLYNPAHQCWKQTHTLHHAEKARFRQGRLPQPCIEEKGATALGHGQKRHFTGGRQHAVTETSNTALPAEVESDPEPLTCVGRDRQQGLTDSRTLPPSACGGGLGEEAWELPGDWGLLLLHLSDSKVLGGFVGACFPSVKPQLLSGPGEGGALLLGDWGALRLGEEEEVLRGGKHRGGFFGGRGFLGVRGSGDWLDDLRGLAWMGDRGGLGDCGEARSAGGPDLEGLTDRGVRGGLGDVGQTGGLGDKGECGGLGDWGDRRSGEWGDRGGLAVTRDRHNLGDCGGVPNPAALESWGLVSLGDGGGVVAVPADFGS